MTTNKKQKSSIRHIWSVLCRRSVIDIDSNTLTLSDVLEQVEVIERRDSDENQVKKRKDNEVSLAKFPFELVTLWDRKEGKEKTIEGKIKITNPKGRVIKEYNYKMLFQKNKKRLRFRLRFEFLPVDESGEYNFSIYIKENTKNGFKKTDSIPLQVKMGNKT